jgi:outer membrane protein assembly factor BamB
MRIVLLGALFLSGCFFGPVQELHDQIEETYFGNDFVNPPSPLNDLKSKINLEVVWQESVGEHNGKNFNIYHLEDFLYVASSDGVIKKLDSTTGDQIWKKELGINLSSGVVGGDENIYVSSIDGFLWCMDLKGNLIWKTLLNGEIDSLPIIYDSKVVVKLNNYKIVQLNTKDGSVIWKYQAAIPPLTYRSEGKIVHSDKVVYLGLPGGKMIAIDSPTGGLVWESNISRARGSTDIERANDITSHPVINGPVIYGITTNGDISALDRRNGKTIWTKPISSFYGMVFDGFNLFITHDTGSIYSVNKDDGEIEWRQPNLKYRRIKTGTIINDYIVYGDYDGFVHFLSIDDGSILGRIKLDDTQILNNIIKIDDLKLALMTEGGEIISLKVGELIDIEEPIENNPEDQKKHRIFNKEYTEEIEVSDKPVQKTKKHRVFDGNEKDLVEEEVPDDEDKRSSKNKKHRVFDKNKKDKGIFDWLF